MTPDMERYFRDVYDHLIRISDLIDSYRDLLTGAMDVYLSTVSNRLNEIMKRLTIVATIFMPLTFIVGFFGMNFTWMVRTSRASGRSSGWRWCPRSSSWSSCSSGSAAGSGSEAGGRRHSGRSTHTPGWSTVTKPSPA